MDSHSSSLLCRSLSPLPQTLLLPLPLTVSLCKCVLKHTHVHTDKTVMWFIEADLPVLYLLRLCHSVCNFSAFSKWKAIFLWINCHCWLLRDYKWIPSIDLTILGILLFLCVFCLIITIFFRHTEQISIFWKVLFGLILYGHNRKKIKIKERHLN